MGSWPELDNLLDCSQRRANSRPNKLARSLRDWIRDDLFHPIWHKTPHAEVTLSPASNGNVPCSRPRLLSLRRCRADASFSRRSA